MVCAVFLNEIVGPAICMYAIHKVLALTSNGAKRSDNFYNSYNFSGGLRPLNSCLMHQLINPVLQQSRDARSRYLQFGESEHLFAEVFQGGSDVIDFCLVYNQEAVVALLVGVDAYRGILAVVLL